MSIEFTFKSSIMKNRQTTILYIMLCCACFFSCQHDNTSELLELAETQIWEKPDSTLRILEQISSPENLKGKEQADYALLLAQAKYRCNIPVLSDSLINITIDYYKEKEDSNRKGTTYLYEEDVLNKLQLKYNTAATLRQNAEIRMKWYLTITIGVVAFIALIPIYFYILKIYRKQKEKELSQHKQKSFRLQTRIDTLQTMVEEKENLYHREKEKTLHEINSLQKEKEKKDTRIKQLETMFRAKDISISSADAEALQTFLRITEQKEYIPAANRENLHHWLNIAHQNFATRLNDKFPSLTGREKDICYLTALGLPLETVALILDVQPRSIERYICRICEKLGFAKKSKESFIDFIIAYAYNRHELSHL